MNKYWSITCSATTHYAVTIKAASREEAELLARDFPFGAEEEQETVWHEPEVGDEFTAEELGLSDEDEP
jgi:hypothetical protein